jgi:hypothetical protein
METIIDVHDLINDGKIELVKSIILSKTIEINQKYKLSYQDTLYL